MWWSSLLAVVLIGVWHTHVANGLRLKASDSNEGDTTDDKTDDHNILLALVRFGEYDTRRGTTIQCQYKVLTSGIGTKFAKLFGLSNFVVTWKPPLRGDLWYGSCTWEHKACLKGGRKAVVLKSSDGSFEDFLQTGPDDQMHYVAKTKYSGVQFVFTDATVNNKPAYMKAFKNGPNPGIPYQDYQKGRLAAATVEFQDNGKSTKHKVYCREYIDQVQKGEIEGAHKFPIFYYQQSNRAEQNLIPGDQYYRHIVRTAGVPPPRPATLPSTTGHSVVVGKVNLEWRCYLSSEWTHYLKENGRTNQPFKTLSWLREMKTSAQQPAPTPTGNGLPNVGGFGKFFVKPGLVEIAYTETGETGEEHVKTVGHVNSITLPKDFSLGTKKIPAKKLIEM